MIYEPFDYRLLQCLERFGSYLDYWDKADLEWLLENAGISANMLIGAAQKNLHNEGIMSGRKTWDSVYKTSMNLLLRMARAESLTMEQLVDYRRLLTSEKGIGNG